MNNLVKRSISGIIFAVIIVAAILFDAKTFVLVFCVITALTVWEFCTLVNTRKDIQVNRLISSVAAVYLYFAVMAFCTDAVGPVVFIPYLLTTIYLLISELYLARPNPVNNWAYAFASQLYVALPFALMNVLAFRTNPATNQVVYLSAYPFAVILFLWANDVGAYCFGSLLQRYVPYKLFPSISPHKSWIGSIGGAVLTMVAALIFSHFYPFMPMIKWIGMALVVVVFGTWGDLVESQIKRNLGVKDSGRFLPGHGGLLDRFDSTLVAVPAVVLYLYTIELI